MKTNAVSFRVAKKLLILLGVIASVDVSALNLVFNEYDLRHNSCDDSFQDIYILNQAGKSIIGPMTVGDTYTSTTTPSTDPIRGLEQIAIQASVRIMDSERLTQTYTCTGMILTGQDVTVNITGGACGEGPTPASCVATGSPVSPPGDYTKTCNSLTWDGKTLTGICETGTPIAPNYSSLDYSTCKGASVENYYGDLKCE